MRFSSFACQSVGKFDARMHPEWVVPGPHKPFARAAFDFHDQNCGSVVLNSHQHWCHRSLHGPTGFALPLWAVDKKYPLWETRIKGSCVATVCLAPGRLPPLSKARHTGEIEDCHTPAAATKNRVTEKGAVRSIQEQIKQLFLAHSFNV